MMVDPKMQIETQLGKPDVFVVACRKCTGEYTIHGKREILEACLISEGWVRQGAYMVCPRCPGARDPIRFHQQRTREEIKVAKRLRKSSPNLSPLTNYLNGYHAAMMCEVIN